MSADEALRRLSAVLLEATLDGHYRVRADDLVAVLGEVASLRERNTTLGLLRVDAESAVERVRALCQGAESNTIGRHVHDGGMLPAVLPVSAVLTIMDGAA